jgi:hypothetical protein
MILWSAFIRGTGENMHCGGHLADIVFGISPKKERSCHCTSLEELAVS